MNVFKIGVRKYGHRDFSGQSAAQTGGAAGKRELGLQSEAVVFGWMQDNELGDSRVHLLYYDRHQSLRPIVVETDETDLSDVSAYSNQLHQMTVEKHNEFDFLNTPAPAGGTKEMIINLDRIILAYEDAAESEDYCFWYDKSRSNLAQIDSPHVDFICVDEGLGGIRTQFIKHLGGKGSLLDLESINVNGNLVNFPDQTFNGIIRSTNIAVIEEDFGGDSLSGATTNKSHITFHGLGQGWQRIIVNHTLTVLITKNEIALTT